MKQFLSVVCLVALTVLAGCSGLVGEAPERSPSLTPAPLPTTAEAFPPGVSDRGVSASTLTTAHRNRLASTNFTMVVRQRVVDSNGTIMRMTRRHRVAVGGEPYYGRYNRTLVRFGTQRAVDSLSYWSGPDGFATRFSGGSGEPVLHWSADSNRSIDIDGSVELSRTVETLELSVADRQGDAVVLVATGASNAQRLPGPSYIGDRHNVSATFVVGLDGLASDWRIAYDARFDERSVRVIHTVRIVEVGSTTVSRPDWVEAARR